MNYRNRTGLALDFTGQTVDGLTLRDCSDVTVTGGAWTGPLVAEGCEGLTVKGLRMDLPADAYKGVFVRGGRNVVIADCEVRGGLDSVVFLGASDCKLLASRLSGFGGDGVHVFASRKVEIAGNVIRDPASDGAHHPDAIQFSNPAGLDPVADVTVSGNLIDGADFQGVNFFDDEGSCVGVVVEFNTIRVGRARAVSLSRCTGRFGFNVVGLAEDNRFGKTLVTLGAGIDLGRNVYGPGVKAVRRG